MMTSMSKAAVLAIAKAAKRPDLGAHATDLGPAMPKCVQCGEIWGTNKNCETCCLGWA